MDKLCVELCNIIINCGFKTEIIKDNLIQRRYKLNNHKYSKSIYYYIQFDGKLVNFSLIADLAYVCGENFEIGSLWLALNKIACKYKNDGIYMNIENDSLRITQTIKTRFFTTATNIYDIHEKFTWACGTTIKSIASLDNFDKF